MSAAQLRCATTSPVFHRWVHRGGRELDTLFAECHRLDWLIWLRHELLPGDHRTQPELLDDVGPFVVESLDATGARSRESDRVVELLAEGRVVQARTAVEAIAPSHSGRWPSMLYTLVHAFVPTSDDERDADSPNAPPWVFVARTAFGLIWSVDPARALEAHAAALGRVRTRGMPSTAWLASTTRDSDGVAGLLTRALASGADRRVITRALLAVTREVAPSTIRDRDELAALLRAVEAWTSGRASAWDVHLARQRVAPPPCGWGAVHRTAQRASSLAFHASMAARGWESDCVLFDWLTWLEASTRPERGAGWIARARARGRHYALKRVLGRTLGGMRRPDGDPIGAADDPIALWLAEISSDARAFFDPDRVPLEQAWHECTRPEWLHAVACAAGVADEIFRRAYEDVLDHACRSVGIDELGGTLDQADVAACEALRVAHGRRAVTLAGHSTIASEITEILDAAALEVRGDRTPSRTAFVLLDPSGDEPQAREYLVAVARHDVLDELGRWQEGQRRCIDAGVRQLSRAVSAHARSAGASEDEARAQLCDRLRASLPWAALRSAGERVPAPESLEAMRIASQRELLPELLA